MGDANTDSELVKPTAFDEFLVKSESDEDIDVILAATRLLNFYDEKYGPVIETAQTLKVDIPDDPVSYGLPKFNQVIAAARTGANTIAPWLSAAVADKNGAYERYKHAKAAYEEKVDLMMANSEEVADVAGQTAKQAKARFLCQREKKIMDYAEQIWRRLSSYHEALKVMFDNLNATNGDMMRQLSVVKQQIALGEVDPTKFPVGNEGPATSRERKIEKDVANQLDGGAGEILI